MHGACYLTVNELPLTAGLGRFETIRPILTLSLEMPALEPKVAVKER